jgi:hypothetical protein
MKKSNLVFISMIILFSLNVVLVKADLVISVKYIGGCPVEGATVRVYTSCCDPVNEVCVGNTNKRGQITCKPPEEVPICPHTYTFKVEINGEEKDIGYVDVNGACTGSKTSILAESCPSGHCVDGYCCNSACGGTCEACNLTSHEGTCTYIPNGQDPNNECSATLCPDSCNIDSNPFTFDYANDQQNYCTGSGSCTSNACIYNHACADPFTADNIFLWDSTVRNCTAECDQNSDCGDKCVGNVRYYNGNCLSSCDCSWTQENCDSKDGWYDTGSTRWVDIDSCNEKEEKEQKYRDYSCSAAVCTYTITGTQWIETGNTRYKDTTTLCNMAYKCSDSIGGNDKYDAWDFKKPSQGYCDGVGHCDWGITGGTVCTLAEGTTEEGTGKTICQDGYSGCRDTCSDSLDNDINGCTDNVDSKCGGKDTTCNNIDDNCNGQKDEDYASIACGDSQCPGVTSCVSGGIVCSSWNTGCNSKKCCQCNGGSQSYPTENYDASQNNDCNIFNITGIATCDNIPDNYHPTWDFRNVFTSQCTGLDQCSNGNSTITHTCNQTTCGAECDSNNPCQNKCVNEIRYYSGSCLSTCSCSYSTENCDLQDGCYAYETGCEDRNYYCTPGSCDYTYSGRNTDYNDAFVNYCSAGTIRKHQQLHDFYCSGTCLDNTSWINDQLVQDCNLQDGWYNTTTTQWISTGQCTEKEQVQQEYRDYTCSAATCTYTITQTRWTDTGQTRNKPNGISCDDGLYCTVNDVCTNGVCGGSSRDCSTNNLPEMARCDNNPDNNLATFDYAQAFTSTCDEVNDKCTTGPQTLTHTCADANAADNWPIIPSGNGVRTCTAQCDQDSDCGTGKTCKADCTCTTDITPPKYSNNVTKPANPALYSPSATYQFNITWIDNVGVSSVILEMDGVNYTVLPSGNTYSMTFSTCQISGGGGGGGHFYMCSMGPIIPLLFLILIFLSLVVRIKKKYNILSVILIALIINLFFVTVSEADATSPCLGIGTHYYKWYANDTSGNWNNTNLLNFTIYKIDPVNIYVYSPENITYSTSSVGVKYSISSPFEISWIGYSLDNKPNITLTGNTSLNLVEGSHNMIFYANTTWGVMNSSQRIYFTVSLPKPDLIIQDILTSGNTISYSIKNQGNANAGSSYSNLWVDGTYKTNDYLSSLTAGSSSSRTFSYSWTCSGISDTIKVCADANSNVLESNENNNCLTKTFTCPAPPPCTCTSWLNTGDLCIGMVNGCYYKYVRTCTPSGCDTQSKCVYGGKAPCAI